MKLTLLKSVLFRSRQAHYYLGVVLVPLLFLLLLTCSTIFDVSSSDSEEPHKAELEYASFSLRTGVSGGKVIPASCDSGVDSHSGAVCGAGGPQAPTGYLDSVTCENGIIYANGWTCDPDNFSARLGVHIYRDGSAGSGTYLGNGTANRTREAGVADACGGDPDHGYRIALPASLSDGTYRNYWAHAIDEGTNGDPGNPVLGNSPRGVACSTMVWTEYCSGAPNYQWWQYSDTTGTRQYQYIRPGDGSCVPQARANISGVTAYCHNTEQDMYFTWSGVPADRYATVFAGLTPGECAAMSWSYDWGSGQCQNWSWGVGSTAISLGPSGIYNLGNMQGRSVTMYVLAGDPWGTAWAGGTASCQNLVWNTYCTGAGNANSNNDWQWWQYSDTVPRQYRYLRAGDGVCRPTQPALSSTCYNGEQNMWFHWPQAPGSIQNQINLYGITEPECNAMGWTPYYYLGVYNTCYAYWPARWLGVSFGAGGTYNLGSMTGRSVTMGLWTKAADSAWSDPQWTTATCRSLPPPPTGGTGSCSADGTVGTFSWTPPSGYNTFYTRGIVTGTPFAYDVFGSNENFVGPPYTQTFTTTPGQSYTWWVHTKDPSIAGVNWSTHIGNSFTCPNPSKPAPATVTRTCAADGNSVNITWAPVAGANRYLPRIIGVTQAQCLAIGWSWLANGTCYYDEWLPAWGTTVTLPLNRGASHSFWIHTGNPIDPAWPSASTGNFVCPLPVATGPATVSHQCNGTTGATVDWVGVGPFNVRIGGAYTAAQCTVANLGPGWFWDGAFNLCVLNNTSLTSMTFPLNPSQSHNFQVYTGGTAYYAQSGSKTCTAASPTVSLTGRIQPSGTPTTTALTIGSIDEVTLQWTSTNVTSCTATAGPGFSTGNATAGSDTDITEPAAGASTIYTVSCTGPGGTITDSLTVTKVALGAAPSTSVAPPTLTIGATSRVVRSGSPAQLWWSVTADYDLSCTVVGANSTSFSFSHIAAPVGAMTTTSRLPASPFITNLLTSLSIFTLTCTPTSPAQAAVGPHSRSVRVELVPNVQEI